MNPVYVSYHTPGPYAGDALLLRESLSALGMDHHVEEVPDPGSWQRATQHKADFIAGQLARWAPRPVVWLDADCVAVKRPHLFHGPVAFRCDVAAVVFRGELLGGTVWFGNTEGARGIVELWRQLNREFPETLPDGREAWDQRTLAMAVRGTAGADFIELPQEYAYMVGLSQEDFPGADPVFLHTRGSLRHNPGHL